MLAVVCSTMIAIICSSISSACLICITRSRWLRILCRGFCGVWLIWLCWFRIRRLWIYWSWICRLRRCGICWIWIVLPSSPPLGGVTGSGVDGSVGSGSTGSVGICSLVCYVCSLYCGCIAPDQRVIYL